MILVTTEHAAICLAYSLGRDADTTHIQIMRQGKYRSVHLNLYM